MNFEQGFAILTRRQLCFISPRLPGCESSPVKTAVCNSSRRLDCARNTCTLTKSAMWSVPRQLRDRRSYGTTPSDMSPPGRAEQAPKDGPGSGQDGGWFSSDGSANMKEGRWDVKRIMG